MTDITTMYAGLKLKSPIIVGSCDLTDSAESNQKFEDFGAGAVVLGSIFEEEIALEYESVMKGLKDHGRNPVNYDYYDYEIRAANLEEVANVIHETKKRVSIPVIASINCAFSHEWTQFARELENAGADALELNMFFMPSDTSRTSQETEALYFRIIDKVLARVSIPVSVKMSYYFSSLAHMIQKLSDSGVASLVLFNRFYNPDFDIDKLEVVSSHVLSTPDELPISLRWVALMHGRVHCHLAASTGVHDGKSMIKHLLAGAQAVQVVSTVYRNGPEVIREMVDELRSWMQAKGFQTLDDFRGKLSQAKSGDPALYERVQFMKYFKRSR